MADGPRGRRRPADEQARRALRDVGGAHAEQLAYMEQLEADGICIFCAEFVESHHREPIEWRGEYWYVTKNDYPYAAPSRTT